MTKPIKLPPLPQGYSERPWDYEGELFTEGQMCAYATADRQERENADAPTNSGEPVAYRWRKPIVDDKGETIGYTDWIYSGQKDFLNWWPHELLYTTPQPSPEGVCKNHPQQSPVKDIPEGYKLVPIEPTAQSIEGEGIVETVTKAILFADCGSTEDWQDNLYLGEAVLQALVPHLPPEMGAPEWAELHILRAERGPSDGGHKTWKEAAIAERCNRVLMAPRKEIIDLAKEGLGVYTGPNMNEHKICAEIVRLSAMLEAAQ